MKPRADFFESFKGLMLASKKMKNRLIRYWGVETIDGVEVFRKKLVVYPPTDPKRVARITNIFGLTDSIANNEYTGLSEFHLKFNPKKIANTSRYTRDIVANRLNTYLGAKATGLITLSASNSANKEKFRGFTTDQITSYFTSSYSSSLTSDIIKSDGETLLGDALGFYLLLDNEQHFTVSLESVATTVAAIPYRSNTNLLLNPRYIYGVSTVLKYTNTSSVDRDSAIVSAILAETDPYRLDHIQVLLDSVSDVESTDTDLIDNEEELVTDAIWYKGQLRVELTKSNILDRNAFADIVAQSIDTGQIKKKVKWYKKLLVAIVFFVAVVIAAVSAAATGGGSLAVLSAFAANMGLVTVGITVLQIALANTSQAGLVTYMGKFAQISGIISTITGLAAAAQNIGKEIAQRGLYDTAKGALLSAIGTTTTTATVASAQVGTQVVETVTTEVVTELSVSKITSIAAKILGKLLEWREGNKAKDLQSQIRQESEEAAKLREELSDMEDKALHLGVEDIKTYTSSLKADNTQFEVDYLYEGTKFNILRPSFYTATALNIRT